MRMAFVAFAMLVVISAGLMQDSQKAQAQDVELQDAWYVFCLPLNPGYSYQPSDCIVAQEASVFDGYIEEVFGPADWQSCADYMNSIGAAGW